MPYRGLWCIFLPQSVPSRKLVQRALAVALSILPLLPNSVAATVKTYTHRVVQQFGGSQSPDDARIAALARAKFEVLEKAGTYLESVTLVLDGAIEKDTIWAMASGILTAEIVSQENFATADSFGIVVEAKVDIDTADIERRIEFMLENRPLLAKVAALRQREKELLQRIEKLENQNARLEQALKSKYGTNLPPPESPAGGLKSFGNMTPQKLRYYVKGMAFDATRGLEEIQIRKSELVNQLPWRK